MDKDYLPEKGWELLRMDMGWSSGAVSVPYFILYNKYRGLIRTFFYLDNSGGTYQNGVSVTMSHTGGNGRQYSGVLALSNQLVRSQDFYLQNTQPNDEKITYVCALSAQTGWVVAEFTAGFDANAGNFGYRSSRLQFQVGGIVRSTLQATGTINFTTLAQNGGYGIGGKETSTVGNVKSFAASGKKVLAAVGASEFTDFLGEFKAKAATTAAQVPLGPVVSKSADLLQAANSAGGSLDAFKKILKGTKAAGAALGLIGTVVGLLYPDEAGSSFQPTVSNGTLTLNGTLETSYPLVPVAMDVPGTQHCALNNNPCNQPAQNNLPAQPNRTDGGTQPYYDCPLGLFTIKRTPLLKRYAFNIQQRLTGIIGHQLFRPYESYQVTTSDLGAVYNAAAGLELESVQAALVAQTNSYDFWLPNYLFTGPPEFKPNLMQQQVNSGEVEVLNADAGMVTYATPFVDLKDFGNQAITVAQGSGVYVRVKAVLKQRQAPLTAAPIYFVQDYAVDVANTQTATNPDFSLAYANSTPYSANQAAPFTNLASPLIAPLIRTQVMIGGFAQFSMVPNPRSFVVPPGTYTRPTIYSALPAIEAGGNPNRRVGDVVVDHPGARERTMYLSATEVRLGEGFAVTDGTEFLAATPLQAWREGSGAAIAIDSYAGPCSYNSNTPYNPVAYRPAGAAAPAVAVRPNTLMAYPNPTAGQLTIATELRADETGELTVFDFMGRELLRVPTVPAGVSTQQLDLSGKSSGLYIIRLVMKGEVLTQKVLLQ